MTEYKAEVQPQPLFLATLPEGTVIPAPQAGWSLEFQRTATHLEVRQVRGSEAMDWFQAIAFADLAGPPGAVPVFAIVDGALAYRFGGSGPWGQLLALAELKGDRGLSAYEVWLGAGNTGTVAGFLASLRGMPGAASTVPGPPGDPGPQGAGGTPNVDLVGTVPPNGAVTAQPLTVYKNTTPGARVQLWLKETGTGNTGWAPLRISTGWINITSLQDPARTVLASSSVFVRRDNDIVSIAAKVVQVAPSSSTTGVLFLPEGFWPIAAVNQTGSATILTAWMGATAQQATFNWYQAFGSLRGFSLGPFTTTARTWDIYGTWYSPQQTIAI
ncbi:hypothetical protein [Pseudoclavibacter sp. AY1H1]|uniref:hypothetical protein n=1 Tax=Pseudoclavibacter sp. AY1H1 TaxID=2080584 RepID=UPI000CE8B320|nr:hypothetical protein [Pseudoclavibacter sp. AY1H1]PPF38328.1 hypothetical protein C5E05_04770 [Pseudoclavibacter sp. AY1H1]